MSMPASEPDSGLVDLHCPLCEYNLRGLSEPRCPECGYQFQWEELRRSQGEKHPYLFEQHADRPAWAFWKTLVSGWRPRAFWRELQPAHRYFPRRLMRYG